MINRRELLRTAVLAALAGGTLPAWGTFGEAESFQLTLGQEGDSGQRLEIRGRVLDTAGMPIEGAEVRVRHADASGIYRPSNIGTMRTDASGRFILQTRMPGTYGRPRHIHTHVFHDAYHPVYTEILFKGDPILGDADPPNAILLENTELQGQQMLLGSFDVVMERL
ncbi:MAG: carboxypeptidase regulatory-like domain-containing protein [Gammaproteobacteria bacterium]|nr:carboxypeptidase regulatory-like domain-containing protein [Gammaproteobacteria bacterium]